MLWLRKAKSSMVQNWEQVSKKDKQKAMGMIAAPNLNQQANGTTSTPDGEDDGLEHGGKSKAANSVRELAAKLEHTIAGEWKLKRKRQEDSDSDSESDESAAGKNTSAKRIRKSQIEKEADRPKLSKDVPEDQRKTTKQLLEIARRPFSYNRHKGALEAFDYRGQLYKNFKYLAFEEDTTGKQVLTADKVRRLIDSVPAVKRYEEYPEVYNSHSEVRVQK